MERKVLSSDPNGTLLLGNSIGDGAGYDIKKSEVSDFYYQNLDGDFRLINEPDHIFGSGRECLGAFTPQDAWRVIITDELSTDMVLLDQDNPL